MATMSHVSVVLPCGATVGFDLCCYSVCARVRRVACVFHRYGKKLVKHMNIVHTNPHVREREKNEYFESKCKHFNVFVVVIGMYYVKKIPIKYFEINQVKVTQVKREHMTHPPTEHLKCQGPQREQRPNSINVNFNPSDGVRNHAGLNRPDTTT